MFYREITSLATRMFFLIHSPPSLAEFFSVKNNSECSVSPVRPDGASGRVRWQHWRIIYLWMDSIRTMQDAYMEASGRTTQETKSSSC